MTAEQLAGTLVQQIYQIDRVQGRRFEKLNETALNIAIEGITRHFRACAKVGTDPDTSAIREIIDDALNGRAVFARTNDDHHNERPKR